MTASRFGFTALLFLSWSALHVNDVGADDWPRFRGPNGSGLSSEDQPLATHWSPQENLQWKTQLPGPGVSSPIVVGNQVFVTCYSGYGVDRRNPGDLKDLKRHLVCIDAKSGDSLWTATVDAVLPEDPYEGIGVTAHGYASHTPVSDGERVFVFFGKSGVLAFDLDGKQLWKKSVGTKSDPWAWGSSSSPVLYKNFLIVTASAESEAIVALDTQTGEQVWRQEASGLVGMWGTPTLVQVDEQRSEIVMSVPYELWSFDPASGKLLWYCEASQAEQAHSSAIASEGVIYTMAGRGGGSIAVRAGGKDDVSQSHVLWKGQESSSFGSPVAYQGKIYLVANGIVTCIDAASGKKLAQVRLDSGTSTTPGEASETGGEGRREGRGGRGGGGFGSSDYASPVIANGQLYYLKGTGETYVFKLTDPLERVAVNKVTQENESFGGSPAISNGRIYVRSSQYLYCVAQE